MTTALQLATLRLARETKKRRSDESDNQIALVRWAGLASFPRALPGVKPDERIGDYLFAVPNGGARSKATAGRLKAEGAKAGVWDLMLALPVGRKHGLWIEMKAGRNNLTAEQRAWRDRMTAAGYECAVCWSWETARDAILAYIGAPRPGILDALDDTEAGELAHQKEKPVRSPTYLRAVASLPCCNCDRDGASQAAHINRGKGLSIKAPDNHTFPLCATVGGQQGCHELYDQYKLGDKHASAEMGQRWATQTYNTLKRAGLVPMNVPAPKF